MLHIFAALEQQRGERTKLKVKTPTHDFVSHFERNRRAVINCSFDKSFLSIFEELKKSRVDTVFQKVS